MTAPEFIAGSFRDRRGRVIRCGNRIFRAMSGDGAKDFARVERTGLLSELIDDGLLVPRRPCARPTAGFVSTSSPPARRGRNRVMRDLRNVDWLSRNSCFDKPDMRPLP